MNKQKASILSQEDINNIISYIKDEKIEDADLDGNTLFVGEYEVDVKWGMDALIEELEKVFSDTPTYSFDIPAKNAIVVFGMEFNTY